MRSDAYSRPLVLVFAAPLSCTTALLRVGLGVRRRPIAARVVPQAMPSTMSESNHAETSLAAVIATWSRRSTSVAESDTGAT